jgi:hypothetical protein
MKVFRLGCPSGHDFEGWFASAEAFESQNHEGRVSCPVCDSRGISRLPSAPYVNTGAAPQTMPVAAPGPSSTAELASALAKLKAYVLAHTDDVGRQFPEVARRIHYGEESPRGIRGRVTAQEAVALREEGVDAVPLPAHLLPDDSVH